MARWRLAAKHYLNIPGTEWEYKEIDRTTGRPKNVKFPVPTLLDPDDPSNWNHIIIRNQAGGPAEGEITVCKGKGEDYDLPFEGDPTPDMVPLDDEAKAISAKFAGRWKHPIETLSGSYADALLDDLQIEVAEVRAQQSSAKIEGMTELLTAMTQMMQQNQQMLATLTAKPAEEAKGRRM